MKEFQDMVREFHEKAGAVINDRPTELDEQTRKLRLDLISEELEELADAFRFFWESPDFEYQPKMAMSSKTHYPVEIADALGDLLYVVLGTAVSCGIDIEPIFREIHRSNMSKFIDGHRREDGKWIKGPSYSPANLEPIIAAQVKAETQPKLKETKSDEELYDLAEQIYWDVENGRGAKAITKLRNLRGEL